MQKMRSRRKREFIEMRIVSLRFGEEEIESIFYFILIFGAIFFLSSPGGL